MPRHIRAALRLVGATIDTTHSLVVIAALRAAANEGIITEYQARKGEHLICLYHATNDNWFNEMLDIMDDKVKVRPSLW